VVRSGGLRLILLAALAVAGGASGAAAALTTTHARRSSDLSGSIVVADAQGIYRRYPGGAVKQLLEGHDGDDVFPVWSSDGKQIAFERQRGLVKKCPLMVMASDGSHVHRVGRFETDCSGAGWAPGGDRLAFGGSPGLGPCTPPKPHCRVDANRESLWVVNADGSGLRRLLDVRAANDGGTHPAWSPDGRTIVFGWTTIAAHKKGTTPGLYSIRPNGSGLHAFVRQHTWGFSQAAWSRDGSRLAYLHLDLSAVVPGYRVVVATSGGREQRTLARLPSEQPQGAPSWSPDGTELAFSGFCGRRSCVWTIPSRGGPRHLLMRGLFLDPNWGPAGT
jgi:Tol biopolymer transport system component